MASSKENKMVTGCGNVTDDIVVGQAPSVAVANTVTVSDSEGNTVTETVSTFDFYSCEEAIKRLNEYLDSELDSSEKEVVLKHLKICAPCLERFEFEKTLIVAMRERLCRSVAPLKLKERLKSLMKNNEKPVV